MRNEEPTKWLGEMTKRVLPERQPAVAKPSALDPIASMQNAQLAPHEWRQQRQQETTKTTVNCLEFGSAAGGL